MTAPFLVWWAASNVVTFATSRLANLIKNLVFISAFDLTLIVMYDKQSEKINEQFCDYKVFHVKFEKVELMIAKVLIIFKYSSSRKNNNSLLLSFCL